MSQKLNETSKKRVESNILFSRFSRTGAPKRGSPQTREC